jgi:DNA-directed RNA polymerase subunit RPC12/RpoP
MAKQSKAIQCPKCGSTQKQEIRPDIYRCDNCGTEYFLDSDDVTLNVRQLPPVAPRRPAMAPVPARNIRWALALAGLVLLWSVGAYFWTRYQRAKSASELQPDPIMTGRIEREEPSAWRSAESVLVPGASGQPLLVVAGGRTEPGQYTYTATVAFYDARTGAMQQQVDLPGGARSQLPTLELERLSNGTLLLCHDNAVYQVQTNPPAVPNVTASLLANQPALAGGVATLNRGTPHDNALHIFTHDGRNLQHYPLSRRTYTDDEAWSAARGWEPGSRRPAGPLRTGFAFSEASHDYPDEPIQLLTYQYRAGDGGPQVTPSFSWRKDFGGSGVFTSADPHTKRLITPQELAQARVVSFRDFTPGRQFFYPSVLYHDADYLLLTYYATASLGSQRFVQGLDARTAAVRFTTPLPADGTVPNQALRYADGFVIGRDRTTYTLSATGQLGPAITCN